VTPSELLRSFARRLRSRAKAATRGRQLLALALQIVAALCLAREASAYSCPQTPSPPKTETYQGFLGRVHELDGEELPYRLFVPENYDPNTAYPLVLYLHHAGLAGTDQNNDSGWDNCVHLTSEIGSGNDYGGVFTHQAVDEAGDRFDTQARYPHFVLAPHANSPAYGFGGGVAGSATGPEHPTRRLLWAILEAVQNEFNIDPGRLYVTGISMGCYGTWDIVMRSPGVFAAASPQSCRGDPNTTLLAALKDMPIWSMCGTNDSYFAGAQAMADAMNEVDATAFTFTAMEGVGHSINDRGYDYPGFIDWLFAQRLPGGEPPGEGGAGGEGGSSAGVAGNGGAPPQGGAAGASGAAGTGSAGVAGNAGNGGSSGQSGGGGAPAGGGGMSGVGTAGLGGGPAAGGMAGTAGVTAAAGGAAGTSAAGAGGPPTPTPGGVTPVADTGCGCRVAGATDRAPGGSPGPFVWIVLGMATFVLRRRQARGPDPQRRRSHSPEIHTRKDG
jgi:MYXO-CTERM domain-containing protein